MSSQHVSRIRITVEEGRQAAAGCPDKGSATTASDNQTLCCSGHQQPGRSAFFVLALPLRLPAWHTVRRHRRDSAPAQLPSCSVARLPGCRTRHCGQCSSTTADRFVHPTMLPDKRCQTNAVKQTQSDKQKSVGRLACFGQIWPDGPETSIVHTRRTSGGV